MYILPISTALIALGLMVSLYMISTVTAFIQLHVRRGNLNRYKHTLADGKPPWAFVTGASDGIGRAFAHALARDGFNVVLHGRNTVKLNTVMSELQDAVPQQSFRILVADASTVRCKNCFDNDSSGGLDFATVKAELQDLNLTVLINNVGGGPRNPALAVLQEHPASHLAAYVSLDALFPLHMIHTVLPTLIQNSPSLIINVGSLGDVGVPYLSYYSACKAFIMALSSSIALEQTVEGDDRVEILGVRVGNATGVTWRKETPSILMPSAQAVAKSAIAKIGCGRTVVTAHWGHALLGALIEITPLWAKNSIIIDAGKQLLLHWEEIEGRKEV